MAAIKSIPYYPGIGYTYRIPRYDNKNIHVSGEVRKEWLQKLKSEHRRFSVYSVCGELSSIEFIKDIFDDPELRDLCDSYEVIYGPQIDTDDIKNELQPMMVANQKLMVFSYPSRPVDHGIKVEDNILLEERHPEGERYKRATIIEKADKWRQDRFMFNFNNLKATSTLKDENTIMDVPVRSKSTVKKV
jgi:hypothetical protein